MNLAALQTFVAIVETGSLVRASERLHVTQSTVTMRLKALEADLGQTVLNRQKSGVTLTPAGTKLLNYAQIMIGLWRQAKLEAGLPTGVNMICNFGCTPELWPIGGKRIFDMIRARQPDIALSVYHGSPEVLDRWTATGQIDLCLTRDPVARKGQTVLPLPADELALYSDRPDTPVRSGSNYIFVDYGEDFRRSHGEEYHDAGTARTTFNAASAALDYLLEVGGSVYLPRSLVAVRTDATGLYEIADAPLFSLGTYLLMPESAKNTWDWIAGAFAQG
ncbi:LysR family transcriptional regulator [Nioella sp. MMSF_3534]|uniref:LysR family transcriptional regulator n=1 Tax=Nioella sp. MMSF_3534 TaxID=3046720 RepID=UPI00273CFD3E|nr:LysR family transcriptional regulator [Nioella sp. MMSF_3534]